MQRKNVQIMEEEEGFLANASGWGKLPTGTSAVPGGRWGRASCPGFANVLVGP